MATLYKVRFSSKFCLEKGNFIIAPESLLEKLMKEDEEEADNSFPYFFRMIRAKDGSCFYSSVIEFTLDEDEIIEMSPYMGLCLGIEEDELIQLNRIRNMMKCKYIEIEPQDERWFDIPDYISILQQEINQFWSLYSGQMIHIFYKDELFFLKIIDVKPDEETLNFALYNQSGNMSCYSTIDQDVNTEILNKFLRERLEKEQQLKLDRQKLQEEKQEKQEKKSKMIETKTKAEGRLVNEDVQQERLSIEELREKRLAKLFQRKEKK